MKTLLNISVFRFGISPASVRLGFSKSKPCVVLFSHVIHLTTLSPGSVKRQVIWHWEKAIGALASTTFQLPRSSPVFNSRLHPSISNIPCIKHGLLKRVLLLSYFISWFINAIFTWLDQPSFQMKIING